MLIRGAGQQCAGPVRAGGSQRPGCARNPWQQRRQLHAGRTAARTVSVGGWPGEPALPAAERTCAARRRTGSQAVLMTTDLLTIGYEGCTIDDVLTTLRKARV